MTGAATAIIRDRKLPIGAAIVTMICAVVALEDAHGQSPMGRNLVYYEAMPNYTPHGIQIPGAMVRQATRALWQQLAYNEEPIQDFEGYYEGSAEFDDAAPSDGYYVSDEYYGGNAIASVEPCLMAVQRYDDHWVHLKADFVVLHKRDDSSNPFVIANDGMTGIPGVADNPVLNTGQTNLDEEQAGVRVAALVDLFYSFDLEFAYFGQIEWRKRAGVSSGALPGGGDNRLFSFLSDFGTNFPADFVPGADQGTRTSIDYVSRLDNFELNTRWRWVHTTHSLTGAWILGVRYLRLDERFVYDSFSSAGNMNGVEEGLGYTTEADNDLVGFQIGGELLAAITPAVMISGDLKAGIYGNRVKTEVVRRTGVGGAAVMAPLGTPRGSQAAFVAEANLMGLADLGHGLFFRGGYTALFVDGVSLAPGAFRRAALADVAALPVPDPTASDNLFTHGYFAGFEWQY